MNFITFLFNCVTLSQKKYFYICVGKTNNNIVIINLKIFQYETIIRH